MRWPRAGGWCWSSGHKPLCRIAGGGEGIALWNVLHDSVSFLPCEKNANCVDVVDGMVAAGFKSGAVKVWDTKTQRLLADFMSQYGAVYSISLSDVGDKVVCGTGKLRTLGGIEIWNIKGGIRTTNIQGHDSGTLTVLFSNDAKWLISGSWDRHARLWDVAKGQLAAWMPCSDSVRAAWFASDNAHVLIADAGATFGRPQVYALEIIEA
jgi:WD40 repeat protein